MNEIMTSAGTHFEDAVKEAVDALAPVLKKHGLTLEKIDFESTKRVPNPGGIKALMALCVG